MTNLEVIAYVQKRLQKRLDRLSATCHHVVGGLAPENDLRKGFEIGIHHEQMGLEEELRKLESLRAYLNQERKREHI